MMETARITKNHGQQARGYPLPVNGDDKPLSVAPSYVVKSYLTRVPKEGNPHRSVSMQQALAQDVGLHLIKSVTYLVDHEQSVETIQNESDTNIIVNSEQDALKLTVHRGGIEGNCSHLYYSSVSNPSKYQDPGRFNLVIKVARSPKKDDGEKSQSANAQDLERILQSTTRLLMNEIEKQSSLSSHPNVIPLLGFSNLGCLAAEKRSIIDTFVVLPTYDSDAEVFFKTHLSIDHMISFLYQIMQGLVFLSNNNIVHQDVKLANCLIHVQDLNWVIADFGGATYLPKNQTIVKNFRLGCTLSTFPPERLYSNQINHTLDTVGWAFMILDLYCILGDFGIPCVQDITIRCRFQDDYFSAFHSLVDFMQQTEYPSLQGRKFEKKLAELRQHFKEKEYSLEIDQYYQQSRAVNSRHRLAFILGPCLVSVIQEHVDKRASKEALVEFLKPMIAHPLAPIT